MDIRGDMREDEGEIAIIGAGICGLSCARALQEAGVGARLFDKARKAGGRMSTRRAGSLSFDHGAQYFTVRDPAFEEQVGRWHADGVAARWRGRIAVAEGGRLEPAEDGPARWVGTPTMSRIPRHLADGLDVVEGTRVAAIEREGAGWRLRGDQGASLGAWSTVLVTTPAAQAVPLLEGAPDLTTRVSSVVMEPCWAAMVAFDEPLAVEIDGLFVNDSPLAWAARNGSKPGREPAPDTWMLHATPAWTRAHWDDHSASVIDDLLAVLGGVTGVPVPEPVHRDAHRWRYARADAPLPERCLFDPRLRVGVGGDWCGGPRVEGAWLSGRALAQRVLAAG